MPEMLLVISLVVIITFLVLEVEMLQRSSTSYVKANRVPFSPLHLNSGRGASSNSLSRATKYLGLVLYCLGLVPHDYSVYFHKYI